MRGCEERGRRKRGDSVENGDMGRKGRLLREVEGEKRNEEEWGKVTLGGGGRGMNRMGGEAAGKGCKEGHPHKTQWVMSFLLCLLEALRTQRLWLSNMAPRTQRAAQMVFKRFIQILH